MTVRGKTRVKCKGGENLATSARTRYRDAAMNWIALGVLLSAWHVEARLDRGHPTPPNARLDVAKPSDAREIQPLWRSESRARSWISHAAAAATANGVQHMVPPAPVHTPLTTVRMIRRWLPDL